MAAGVTVGELSSSAVSANTDELAEVYGRAFAAPPYSKSPEQARLFAAILDQHRRYPGFRLVGAWLGEPGRLAGFGYGYHSGPGQWWHDVVRPALGKELAGVWLANAFEVGELAVRPEFQRQGIGGRVLDALLARRSERTAVLSTIARPTGARRLYRKRGWIVLIDSLRFPATPEPYSVLGLALQPLDRA
jgi:GNAT superfamily N-acetyltransferase